jgi:hypothetical protein
MRLDASRQVRRPYFPEKGSTMSERDIVTVTFPVDVDLFLKIGMTVADWHDDRCEIDACRVWIRGHGHQGSTFTHGLAGEDVIPEAEEASAG